MQVFSHVHNAPERQLKITGHAYKTAWEHKLILIRELLQKIVKPFQF